MGDVRFSHRPDPPGDAADSAAGGQRPPRGSASLDGCLGRRLAWCFLPGVLVGLAAIGARWSAGGFGESFGGGHFLMNGAGFTSRIARLLDYHGFQAMRFGLPFMVLPTEPPAPIYYLNHPGLYFLSQGLLYRIFAPNPVVLQVAEACVFLLIAVVAAAFFGPRRPFAGAAAGLVAASIPVGSHFGFMVNSFGPCILFGGLAILGFRRWRQTGRPGSLVLGLIAAAVACQADWWGYFLFPAAGVDFLLSRSPRRWTGLGLLLGLALVNVALSALYLGYVQGKLPQGFDTLADHFHTAAQQRGRLGPSDGRWWSAVGGFLVAGLTWPGVVVMGWGIVSGLRRGNPGLVLGLGAAGMVVPLALSGHASTHDFFVHPFVYLAAAAGGLAFEPVLAAGGRRRTGGLIVIGTLAGFWIATSSRLYCELGIDPNPGLEAKVIERLATVDDVVLTSWDSRCLGGYTCVPVHGPVTEVDHLEGLLRSAAPLVWRGRVLYLLGPAEADTSAGRYVRENLTGSGLGPLLVYDLRPR